MYPYKIYNSINHFGNCALPSSESISRSGFKFLAKHSAIIKAIFEEIIVIQNTESCHKIWYFAKILHFSKVAQASETTKPPFFAHASGKRNKKIFIIIMIINS